jgi:hypothetical protein
MPDATTDTTENIGIGPVITNKTSDLMNMAKPLIEDLPTDFDKNKDGKVSLLEFFAGLMKFPKYLAIFASVISGMYSLYKIISGWVQQNMDLETIIFLIAITIGMLVLFLGFNSSGKNTMETIKQIRLEFKDTIESKDKIIRGLEKDKNILKGIIEEKKEIILTKTINSGLYEWAFKFIQNTNPNLNIPDPTT